MNHEPPTPNLDPSPDCTAFEAVVQRVLDGELSREQLGERHPQTCSACRDLLKATAAFTVFPTPVPKPSAGLNRRVLQTVLHDRRQRRQRRLLVGGSALAMAACLFISLGVYFTQTGSKPTPEIVEVAPKPPAINTPRVTDQVAEAGSALTAMTRRATEQAMRPTRSLFPIDPTTVPQIDLPATMDPATESLAALPSAAKSGLEPITDGTRRAVNLFLRDVGFSPKLKS